MWLAHSFIVLNGRKKRQRKCTIPFSMNRNNRNNITPEKR